MFLFFVIFK